MVLITGASGFLGQHLVRYLSAQGVKVRALYYSHPPADGLKNLPGIEWMQCDLLDVYAVEEAMRGITDIYHCAAVVTFDPGKRKEMLHFNPESTANIVNQALLQDVRKMVYVSSIASLGRTGDQGKEITEEEEWGESRYNSAYGISKYIAEMEVWRGIGEGLNAVIVNPGIIIGAGNGHDLSARLMKIVYREFPFYSKGVNSWVGSEDVVKIMVQLMSSDIEGERFIVSTANLSYREVLGQMAKALGKKPARYRATAWMTGIAWRLSILRSMITGKSPLITRETVNNANSICLYNNSKLLTALPGFAYAPLEASIATMARSFINYNKK
ncbi:MAG: NAD-dependent epimerase/dehydratase family protein [Flavipsychrobacter sp.]|jgi:nucleoside-diphosphate-sugar epimerase|nr:NAD-dependent epimerase/dehydratase family protein [Flavipsychrobacter sp.]